MINETILNQVIADAKSKTTDAKWLRQLDRVQAGLLGGEIIVTLFCDGYALVTTPNGSYRVNGKCCCKAAEFGDTKCWHRVAKRVWESYETAACKAALPTTFRSDVAGSSRQNIIAEIENIWPRVETTPLSVALMSRFGKNKLEMLDDDMLRRVRLAIAM